MNVHKRIPLACRPIYVVCVASDDMPRGTRTRSGLGPVSSRLTGLLLRAHLTMLLEEELAQNAKGVLGAKTVPTLAPAATPIVPRESPTGGVDGAGVCGGRTYIFAGSRNISRRPAETKGLILVFKISRTVCAPGRGWLSAGTSTRLGLGLAVASAGWAFVSG